MVSVGRASATTVAKVDAVFLFKKERWPFVFFTPIASFRDNLKPLINLVMPPACKIFFVTFL